MCMYIHTVGIAAAEQKTFDHLVQTMKDDRYNLVPDSVFEDKSDGLIRGRVVKSFWGSVYNDGEIILEKKPYEMKHTAEMQDLAFASLKLLKEEIQRMKRDGWTVMSDDGVERVYRKDNVFIVRMFKVKIIYQAAPKESFEIGGEELIIE